MTRREHWLASLKEGDEIVRRMPRYNRTMYQRFPVDAVVKATRDTIYVYDVRTGKQFSRRTGLEINSDRPNAKPSELESIVEPHPELKRRWAEYCARLNAYWMFSNSQFLGALLDENPLTSMPYRFVEEFDTAVKHYEEWCSQKEEEARTHLRLYYNSDGLPVQEVAVER